MPEEAGYKITVKDVHKEVLTIKDVMLPKIWDSQNDICRKLDSYNGLHDKVKTLAVEVSENKKYVKNLHEQLQTTKTKEETEADVMKRISEAKEITRRVEHDKFMRMLKVFIAVVAVVGLIAGYLW